MSIIDHMLRSQDRFTPVITGQSSHIAAISLNRITIDQRLLRGEISFNPPRSKSQCLKRYQDMEYIIH